MANEKLESEVDELAFRLYVERVARMPAAVSGEQFAIQSFKRAEEFLAVRARVRKGEVVTADPVGPQLSDASTPNMAKSHPYNLVSKRFGNDQIHGIQGVGLARIKRINDWLVAHPRTDNDPPVYGDLGWDAATTNLARDIFPAYCGN